MSLVCHTAPFKQPGKSRSQIEMATFNSEIVIYGLLLWKIVAAHVGRLLVIAKECNWQQGKTCKAEDVLNSLASFQVGLQSLLWEKGYFSNLKWKTVNNSMHMSIYMFTYNAENKEGYLNCPTHLKVLGNLSTGRSYLFFTMTK